MLKRRGNPKVHVVRHADDFIVIGPSKKMLLVLKPAVDEFLLEKNLEIPQEKSFLFNIRENEIRFFGFSFRKRKFNYRTKSETAWKNKNTKSSARIDILPSQEKQKLFKLKVKKIISVHSDVSTLIIVLNQYLKG